MPPETFDAYRDHGEPAVRDHARGWPRRPAAQGAGARRGSTLAEVTDELEHEGVKKFAAVLRMQLLARDREPRRGLAGRRPARSLRASPLHLAHLVDRHRDGGRRGPGLPGQAVWTGHRTAPGSSRCPTIFLRMIKSIVVPLIFGTLVVGIAGHGDDLKRVGRLARQVDRLFQLVTTVALVIGLVAVNLPARASAWCSRVRRPPASSSPATNHDLRRVSWSTRSRRVSSRRRPTTKCSRSSSSPSSSPWR